MHGKYKHVNIIRSKKKVFFFFSFIMSQTWVEEIALWQSPLTGIFFAFEFYSVELWVSDLLGMHC